MKPLTVCAQGDCIALVRTGARCPFHTYPRFAGAGRGSTRSWRKQRALILNRDGYRCTVCGREADQVDHIIPVARGGTDDADNLRAICARDNLRKGARRG